MGKCLSSVDAIDTATGLSVAWCTRSGEGMSDDGGDLFESDVEDRYSEVGNSLDLPALLLEDLQVHARPRSDDQEERQMELESEERMTDFSGAGGFERSVATMHSAVDEDSDAEQSYHHERDCDEDNMGYPLTTVLLEQSGGADYEQFAADESATSERIAHPDSPRIFDAADLEEQSDCIDEPGNDEEICAQTAQVDAGCHQTAILEDTELVREAELEDTELVRGSEQLPTTLIGNEDHISIDQNSGQPASGQQFDSEVELPATIIPEEEIDSRVEEGEQSRQENLNDESGTSLAEPIPVKAVKSPKYTVESLFPVRYEKRVLPTSSREKATEVVRFAEPAVPSNHERRKSSTRTRVSASIGSTLSSLQAQLDAARSELANTTHTFKLQLSMVETDNKKLSQRNARLKTQLAGATADLQRSNAELAKLKTENELYAAKLPRLQAELLQETSQVDQTQAQSMQAQLVLTQLKARSHVLQTRNQTLETKNDKLTQQLRECQQQLQRKATALQQQTERMSKLESETSELKASHMQDQLAWKNRLTSAQQRFEHAKTKLDAEWRSKERKELREAKERVEKTFKKWRTADAMTAKLEEQLKHYKREVAESAEATQVYMSENRNLESLLRKAHQTEASLRNELAACKTKVIGLQDDKRRAASRRTSEMQGRRRRPEHQIPIKLILPRTDSSDEDEDDDEDNQEYSCCHSSNVGYPNKLQFASEIVCNECPDLQKQLRRMKDELRRVRELHTAELQAQGAVLDSLLTRSS